MYLIYRWDHLKILDIQTIRKTKAKLKTEKGKSRKK